MKFCKSIKCLIAVCRLAVLSYNSSKICIVFMNNFVSLRKIVIEVSLNEIFHLFSPSNASNITLIMRTFDPELAMCIV